MLRFVQDTTDNKVDYFIYDDEEYELGSLQRTFHPSKQYVLFSSVVPYTSEDLQQIIEKLKELNNEK